MRYPFLKKNVLLYDDKKGSLFLINPYRNSAQKLSRLNKNEALLLRRLNGRNKIEDIFKRLPNNKKDNLNSLKKWAGKEWNMVEFLSQPARKISAARKKEAKFQNILLGLRNEAVSVEQAGRDNGQAIKEYHQDKIRDAWKQFEQVERTVSHLFRKPHVLLGGKNYGASFAGVLLRKGAIPEGASILEVGGGIGIFGKSFLGEIKKTNPKLYRSVKYTFFDISPVLLSSQRKAAKEHRRLTEFIQGDIEKYNFKNKKFDLVISNEMIADLATVKLKKKINKRYFRKLLKPEKKARLLINKFNFDISNALDEFLFNLGAVEFLGVIKGILKPRGSAYIVEYGSKWSYPKAVYLKGHAEYSIHFGQLIKAAEKLNLNPCIASLADFLPFNKKIRIVNNVQWFCINNYLLPFLNLVKIPELLITECMARKKVGKVFNKLSFVKFSRIGSGEVFLDPAGFYVLELGFAPRSTPQAADPR